MIFQEACWGIDIGKNSIKAVRIRKDKGRVEIKAVDRIGYDRTDEGMPSAEEIARALKIFISRNSIRATDSVAVALPGHMALIRFVKVPQLATAEIADTIVGEAQQQIPFPLDEVMWGFQKIDKAYKAGEEVEVGIFAIKKEIIDNFLSDFDDTGLEVDILTIAPLALFNFVKYEMKISENTVVVDIGADHTDLVIIEGNKFYVRELAIGGNDVSKILMDTFSISFAEAEEFKKKAAQSSQAAKIYKIMQPVFRDFVSEVQRSLGFYKSQSPGAQFPGLVLLGNGSKLAGLPKYFGQQLGMKVHYLMDIERIELDRDVNIDVLQDHLPTFGIAMGLALQGLGVTINTVNLIPRERKGQKEFTRKLPLLLLSAVLLYLLLAFAWFDGAKHLKRLDDLIDKTKQTVDDLSEMSEKAGKMRGPVGRIGKGDEPPHRTSMRRYKDEAELIASLAINRSKPLASVNRLMEVLNTAFEQTDAVVPCSMTNNIKVHPRLLGKNRKQLKKDGLNDNTVRDLMHDVNQSKLWILDYSVRVKRLKGGSERLLHRLTGAIQWFKTNKASEQRVNAGIIKAIKKKFNIKAETKMLTEARDANVLLPPTGEKSAGVEGKAGEFYRFTIEWDEPIRGKRPRLPKKRAKKTQELK